MIQVYENKKCCGCNACIQICPKNCIENVIDNEGFHYPVVDLSICIECNLCESVCPMIKENNKGTNIKVLAAQNLNSEIRRKSSSGGIFSILAENTIENGGVVFGAGFNEKFKLVHSYSETIEGIEKFRGSKYIQSEIGDSFNLVKNFLNQNRKVLFSGTPCQITGLKNFLKKGNENLVTVDFICHGVASPLIFNLFLEKSLLLKNKQKHLISHISFRDKTYGWHSYGLTINAKNLDNSEEALLTKFDTKDFYVGYGANLFLRPSCHCCPSKNLSSGSDITLADFWGMEELYPEKDDNGGHSLVLINTINGHDLIDKLKDKYQSFEVDFHKALKTQTSLFQSVTPSKYREIFFKNVNNNNVVELIKYYGSKRPLKKSIIITTKRILRLTGIKKIYKGLLKIVKV